MIRSEHFWVRFVGYLAILAAGLAGLGLIVAVISFIINNGFWYVLPVVFLVWFAGAMAWKKPE